MNVLLWVLQVALALLYLAGGAYKVFKFDELANSLRALSRGGWRALGLLEMLGAVLLIVPAAANWMPVLTPLAAAALALETLALAGLYARYSLKVAATNPMVWAVVMGLLAAFVAYGRYALKPLGRDDRSRTVHTGSGQRSAGPKRRREVDAHSRQRPAPLAGKGLAGADRPGAAARVGALRRRWEPGYGWNHGEAHHGGSAHAARYRNNSDASRRSQGA